MRRVALPRYSSGIMAWVAGFMASVGELWRRWRVA
jgi:hypothetical protein